VKFFFSVSTAAKPARKNPAFSGGPKVDISNGMKENQRKT
jgi:hypothetical protein